jgi:protein-arginine kinase activator protein McsA
VRCPPINPSHETRFCQQCGEPFAWVRRNQRFCSEECHHAHVYKLPKWVVTRVTSAAGGGIAFSVSIGGDPAIGGFYMKEVGSSIFFPRKLCISRNRKARLFKSLQRQVSRLVEKKESAAILEAESSKPKELQPCKLCGHKAEVSVLTRADGATTRHISCDNCGSSEWTQVTPATKRKNPDTHLWEPIPT